MAISCRTGCGKQIIYELYPFPDGFIYFLPLNLDETIHDCPNLPENTAGLWPNEESVPRGGDIIEYVEKRKLVPNDYSMEYAGTDIQIKYEFERIVGSRLTNEEKEKEYISLYKDGIINLHIRCLLFPSPFMYNYGDDLEINSTNERITDLIELSMCYESLGNFKSAITARLIQDKITHDQTEKIINLVNKENNIHSEKQQEILKLNISALELRDKFYRKVEQIIKSFIRKKYSNIKDFQKDFPSLFLNADKLRENPSKHIKHEHDDVIEFLSFGASVKILKANRKSNKNWKVIDWDIINNAYYVVDRRNDMEHYSDDKLEESIPKESKALGYIFSKDIIDFFKKINYV